MVRASGRVACVKSALAAVAKYGGWWSLEVLVQGAAWAGSDEGLFLASV